MQGNGTPAKESRQEDALRGVFFCLIHLSVNVSLAAHLLPNSVQHVDGIPPHFDGVAVDGAQADEHNTQKYARPRGGKSSWAGVFGCSGRGRGFSLFGKF